MFNTNSKIIRLAQIETKHNTQERTKRIDMRSEISFCFLFLHFVMNNFHNGLAPFHVAREINQFSSSLDGTDEVGADYFA